MKKINIIILFSLMILLSGCSATYELEIGDGFVNEKTTLNLTDDEIVEFDSDGNNKYQNAYYNDSNDTAAEGTTLPIKGVKYYDFSKNGNEISYEYKYDYNNFIRSSASREGFLDYKFRVNNNEIHLKTSEGFALNENLSSVIIKIKSKYEVMNSNADKVDGDTLIWYIDSSNAETKYLIADYTMKKKEGAKEPTNNTDNTKDDNKDNQISEEEKEKNHNDTMIYLGIGILSFVLVLSMVLIISKKRR